MMTQPTRLSQAVMLSSSKTLNPSALSAHGGISSDVPTLLVLAAGKGTRFGQEPKCIQPIMGRPLARHSIDAFRHIFPAPAICIVGYRYAEVSTALGPDNLYVQSTNPAGGTGLATFEAFCLSSLLEQNPLLIITMGDRIVPPTIYQQLWERHVQGTQEADLTLLTAHYKPPKNQGKGRILRDESGKLLGILEQRDIEAEEDEVKREVLLDLTEGNCPLYIIRARKLYQLLQPLTNANAQNQYYLTDIIDTIHQSGGEIRSINTSPTDPNYQLLCADLTRAADLPRLEQIVASAQPILFPNADEIRHAAHQLSNNRRPGQSASIARQLSILVRKAARGEFDIDPTRPLAIGIASGRLRIAFMHPDMSRFYGPAWQMPIGAADESGDEQIVILAQLTDDNRIHFHTTDGAYRESVDSISTDYLSMDMTNDHINEYETFGTQMSKNILMGLGYLSDEEVVTREARGEPLPPPNHWASNNMRRPFPLIANAIASMRTLKDQNKKVQEALGQEAFRGLRLVATGNIPQGGFASSSALTVAILNGLNALFELGLEDDTLVRLACQAEYGTGVRAGSLDQMIAQKGEAGVGTLLSSNPQESYRVLANFPVPTERFKILFPYSIERDQEAWRWSWGFYGAVSVADNPLTTNEMRILSGKAAEIAAILVNLPFDQSFFQQIESDLLRDGILSQPKASWICSILRQIPLLIRREELRQRLLSQREWLIEQLVEHHQLCIAEASQQAEAKIEFLLDGWREPHLRRTTAQGDVVTERGVPLRAMLAYLFGEVAKNFALIHHPEQWIDYVTLSQQGDICFDIDPTRLPTQAEMEKILPWEEAYTGPARLNCWLERYGATPFDYNQELDDNSLSIENPPEFYRLKGTNFFRGLALIDLAEAMLKRAFGQNNVAIRVNAAGQGGYFQLHVDRTQVEIESIKQFLESAFYRRFDLSPTPQFVEVHSGGRAVGVRLNRFELLPQLIQELQSVSNAEI